MKVKSNLKAGKSYPAQSNTLDNELSSPSKENFIPPSLMGICIPTDLHNSPLNNCIVT